MKVSIGEIWLAPGKYNIFWRSPIWKTVIFDDRIKPNFVKVIFCPRSFLIWNGAHRCLVNAVLAPSEAYSTWTFFSPFLVIHFSHKTPSDFIKNNKKTIKKNICKTHQTPVSVAPNALEPLNYLASHCSFGCSAPKTVFFFLKHLNRWGIIEKSENR